MLIATQPDGSVNFFVQKSPNVHKSMLLRGANLKPRRLNEMDTELMRRHATTHDRLFGFSWQSRESPRTGTPQEGYISQRTNGNPQGQGEQHMRWYPPASTPGIPPSNAQASQWYQQTSVSYGAVSNGSHSSGIMRLEDLRAQFGSNSRDGAPSGDSRRGYSDRGYYSQDRRSGGSGYYQNQYSGSGTGSGYRDYRR